MQPPGPPRRCDSNQEPSSKPGAIHFGSGSFHPHRSGSTRWTFRDELFPMSSRGSSLPGETSLPTNLDGHQGVLLLRVEIAGESPSIVPLVPP
jgi:hypothetical protein